MFDWIASPEAWVALGTFTALEIACLDRMIVPGGTVHEDKADT